MAINKKSLSDEIMEQMPTIKKPEEYADLILEGKRLGAVDKIHAVKRLGAVDKIHAVKRKTFLESNIISASIFQSSYSRLGFLDKLASMDKTIGVFSTRHQNSVFAYSMILSYLNYERYLLYKQMLRDRRVKKILCDVLNISIQTSTESIENKMQFGTPYNQVEIYKKIYDKVKRERIQTDCMHLGVVRMPAFRYCLSDLSHLLLRKSKS